MSFPRLSRPDERTSSRFPALVWALLHVPIFLALFASSIHSAVQSKAATS